MLINPIFDIGCAIAESGRVDIFTILTLFKLNHRILGNLNCCKTPNFEVINVCTEGAIHAIP